MENEKLCPFRKWKESTHFEYSYNGNALAPQIVQEDFLPCIGEKCMAYSRTGKCLLMKEEEFPYNAITDEFINILERGKNNVS